MRLHEILLLLSHESHQRMHKIMEKRKFVQVKNRDVYFTLIVCVRLLKKKCCKDSILKGMQEYCETSR